MTGLARTQFFLNLLIFVVLDEEEGAEANPGCSLCGICRICTCLHYEFLKTPIGMLKLVELILALAIQYTLTTHAKPE